MISDALENVPHFKWHARNRRIVFEFLLKIKTHQERKRITTITNTLNYIKTQSYVYKWGF